MDDSTRHDLRTPLALVVGFADALARRGESMTAAERRDYAERLHRAALELRDLIDAAGR